MRDIAVKFDNVGDVITAGEFNSDQHEIENMVNTTGQTLDNSAGPDTDLYMLSKAAAAYGSGGDYYNDGGTANNYVLTRSTFLKSPPAYADGMRVVFYPLNSNTGTSTVDVAGLGSRYLRDIDGSQLVVGSIIAGQPVVAVYKSSIAGFVVLRGAVPFTNLNASGGFISGYKNKINNGAFYVWTRGTSFSPVSSGDITADTWRYAAFGSMVFDASQVTDAPALAYGPSHKLTCTTAQGSIGVNDYAMLKTYTEGIDLAAMLVSHPARYCTLSFWVKSYKTGTYCVSLSNSALDRSFVAEYTVNAANTWEYKMISVPLNYSGGVWDYTTGKGLEIRFLLAAGTGKQTATVGSWITGDYYATSNQVNACDTASGAVLLKNVQLEAGKYDTFFEHTDLQSYARRCYRYTVKLSPLNLGYGIIQSGGAASIRTPLPVTMRVAPTLSGPTTYQVYVAGTLYSLSITSIILGPASIVTAWTSAAPSGHSVVMAADTAVTIDATWA